jgi:phosphoglycerol transferase
VFEFVEWIKTQPFYENTTVIVTGDHLTMDDSYIRRTAGADFDRRVYNCILNAPITPKSEKNREFCTFDMFPTTLASLGCEIKGERLGLGTNLFSGEKTLIEKYGADYLNDELNKMSDYYNNKILNAYN